MSTEHVGSVRLVDLVQIREAQQRIAGTAVVTPLIELQLDREPGAPTIFLKLENEQPIGSFKLRGAYNKIASLSADQLSRGVITYSSGNHAQGVSYAARKLGSKAVIVMPSTSPVIKQEMTRALGGEVVIVGPASSERKQKAEELEAAYGYAMVPPYDDPFVIAGQATCGLEIIEQKPDLELVLSPVSGGGLLSGISTAVKLLKPTAKVYGIEPALAGDAAESFRTQHIVEWPAEKTSSTIADGLRTQSLGESNFAHILKYTDGILTVTEEQILAATTILLQHGIIAEPSGAVTLAGALYLWRDLPPAASVVCVVSGGNLDPALKDRLLTSGV